MVDVDGGVRHLVLVHGREQARAMVDPELRNLVDIAAAVLGDDEQAIGITYTGFCLTALPHKRLPNDQVWKKNGHRVCLIVEPGWIHSLSTSADLEIVAYEALKHFGPIEAINSKDYGPQAIKIPMPLRKAHVRKLSAGFPEAHIGVPYGARARMILLYLQTEAIRTSSREIELGRSMRDWLGRMGLPWGGETGRAFKEQAQRISACSLKFFWEGQDVQGWEAGRFVRSGLRFHPMHSLGDRRKDGLWEDRVVLDETLYNALRQHSVPLRETALRQLADRSASLDVYVWLAYRLYSLVKPTPIRWAALQAQFGSHYTSARNFRRDFRKALAAAVAAYPEARVFLAEDDSGLVLHPSRPPVAPRLVPGTRFPF